MSAESWIGGTAEQAMCRGKVQQGWARRSWVRVINLMCRWWLLTTRTLRRQKSRPLISIWTKRLHSIETRTHYRTRRSRNCRIFSSWQCYPDHEQQRSANAPGACIEPGGPAANCVMCCCRDYKVFGIPAHAEGEHASTSPGEASPILPTGGSQRSVLHLEGWSRIGTADDHPDYVVK